MSETGVSDVVTFCINSQGGDAHTALGLFDIIKKCSQSRNTIGLVCGRAESGGSLILQACEERIMTSSSVLMLHRSTVSFNGTIAEATRTLAKFQTLEYRFFSIYANRSNMTPEEVAEAAMHSKFYSSDLALDVGLVDKVL